MISGLAYAAGPEVIPKAPPQRVEATGLDQSVKFANTMASRLDDVVEVFIRLDMPSVGEYVKEEEEAGRGHPDKAKQKAHYHKVMAEQSDLRAMLADYGVEELSALQVGANGLRVKVRMRDLPKIKSLPGVVSVGRVSHFEPRLVDSVPWVGAPTVWNDLGITGEGQTIAVIDTGIDYTHANFGGSGDPADYASNDPDIVEPGTFPTAKVTFGWDFVGTNFNASSPDPAINTPVPDPDPLDENFHGSHVAGDAAGMGVPGSIGPGVAKGAELWALKVFGASGSTNVTSDAIELALDPNQDGSIDDHADVINLSLGSDLGDPNDPTAIAAQTASELGIIVVVAAGNAGDVPYVHSSPAAAPATISVAASVPGNRFESTFTVTAPPSEAGTFPNLEGAGPVRVKDVAPLSGQLVPAAPLDGCSPLTNGSDIAGKIAFVIRGACFFNDKYLNAQNAGAIAIVVFNDGASSTRIDPIVMGGISNAVTIPGVMISATEGFKLLNAISGGATVEVTLDVVPNTATADTIAGFSSRGPGGGGTLFKPDVTGPGVSIVSTGFASGTGAINSSGTSFATPHVAGEAALLHQIHPYLEPAAIKAMIQNATVTAHVDGLGGSIAYPLARQGVGVMSVDAAAKLTSFAAPGGVSFGRVNPTGKTERERKVVVYNLGDTGRTFTVTHVPNQTFPGVEVKAEDTEVYVPPHGSAKLELELEMDGTVGPFDVGGFTQTEVDGWFVLSDGTDELRVGYLAAVDPASDMEVKSRHGGTIEVRNEKGSIGFAEGFTLVGRMLAMRDDDDHKKGKKGKKDDDDHAGPPPVVGNAIRAFGFRNSYFGFDAVEFAVAVTKPWDTPSAFEFDIFIDGNEDGVFESVLVAADLGLLLGQDPSGQVATAIFPLTPDSPAAGAFLLFFADGDLNDSSIILPFQLNDPGFPFANFLAPGDTDFNFLLAAFDLRSGLFDLKDGRIDLTDEVVPLLGGSELSSFGLLPDSRVPLETVGGPGRMLWLFQNNQNPTQAQAVRIEGLGAIEDAE